MYFDYSRSRILTNEEYMDEFGEGLRQKSKYIRTNCIDRSDFSSYYLHAIWQSDNRRHPWKKN